MNSLEQRFAESRAVVLDIDGVLVNNFMSVITQSSQLVKVMRGEFMPPSQILDIQINNIKTDDILEELVHPTAEEWPKVRELHQQFFMQNSLMPPIGQPAKFVQDIRDSGRKSALWTSRPQEFLTPLSCYGFVLDDDNPFALFDAVSTHKGRERDKPHPDSLRAVAAELGIPESDYGKIVVVEDMPQNIEVVKEVGMLTVGVTTGMLGEHVKVRARLEAAEPDLLLSNYDQLRPYLELPPA